MNITIEHVLSQLHGVIQAGDGYKALCPCHNDTNPSLNITERNGKLLIKCLSSACGAGYREVMERLGLVQQDTPRVLIHTYNYEAEDGTLLFQKLRYEPKTFSLRAANGSNSMAGIRRVLYHLPDLIQARQDHRTVFLVEGEKDADTLRAQGFIATTNLEGASENGKKQKWNPDYTEQLGGIPRVVILPDNDDAGRARAGAIATALIGRVPDVRVIDLPGLPNKGDVTDWLKTHTADDLKELVKGSIKVSAEKLLEALPSYYFKAKNLWGKSFAKTWIIEGLFERGRLYQMFGSYKSGKTLVAIDAVCHLAADMTWCNRRVSKAFVIWVAGEAFDDVERRMAAWQRRHRVTHDIPLYIRSVPAYLDQSKEAVTLKDEIALIQKVHPDRSPFFVLDTVARNLTPGADENSLQGMGAFVNHLIDIVVRPLNATGICIHHPGHGDGDRGRGHSSLPGATDGNLKVSLTKSAGASIVTLQAINMRDSCGDQQHSFRIEVQVLPGQDNFGQPIEAPILRSIEGTLEAKQATLGDCAALAAGVLRGMLSDAEESVLVSSWRQEFKERHMEASDHPDKEQRNKSANSAWKKAIAVLERKGIIAYEGSVEYPKAYLASD